MLFRYYPLNVAALVLAVWNLNEMEFYLLFIYIFFRVPSPPKVWSAVQKQAPMTVLFQIIIKKIIKKIGSYIMQKAEYFCA